MGYRPLIGTLSYSPTVTATNISEAEFTIPTFIVYEEDGVTPVLDEEGNYVREEYVGPVFVIEEDGTIKTEEDGVTPVLDESSQPSVYGGINPIVNESTECLWAVIQAKWTNQKPVRIGGVNLRSGEGIRLLADAQLQIPTIDNLDKIYIEGYIGDGIRIIYGKISESVDSGLAFGGDQLTFGGDSLTFGS